jgi:hypothetical protein
LKVTKLRLFFRTLKLLDGDPSSQFRSDFRHISPIFNHTFPWTLSVALPPEKLIVNILLAYMKDIISFLLPQLGIHSRMLSPVMFRLENIKRSQITIKDKYPPFQGSIGLSKFSEHLRWLDE